MMSSLGKAVVRHPTSFGNWACLLQELIVGTSEIAVVGEQFATFLEEVIGQYIPHRVLMASNTSDKNYQLLAQKQGAEKTMIYLCRNYTCLNPVFSAKDLMSLINSYKNQ